MNTQNVVYKHLINFQGTDGKINDNPCRFLITECSDSETDGIDFKNITTNAVLKQGDYITINNDDSMYMVIDIKKVNNSDYTQGTYRKINHIAKFVDNEIINTLPCICTNVSKARLPIAVETSGITEGSGIFSFIVQLNETSKKIRVGKRFLINGDAWEVVSNDYTTEEDIFYTILKQGSISSETDDLINEVANGLNLPTFAITLNSISESLYRNGTFEIVPNCTRNGVVDTSATVTYSSSDETITTVSNTGIVSIKDKLGSAIISIKYKDKVATLTVNVVEDVYNITLAENSAVKYNDETYQLEFTCLKNNNVVSSPTIIYSSSNSEIATVNESGLITSISNGTCNIICNFENVSATFNLIVNAHTYEVTLSETSTSIIQDGTYNISATCKKDGIEVSDPIIVYSSSDPTIATVSSDGTVSAISVGTATITINYENVSSVLNVEVQEKPVVHTYTIDLSENSNSLYLGDTLQLSAVCKDNDAIVDSPIVSWSSSDTNIVSIDSNGLAESIALGSATITAEFNGVSTTLNLGVIERPHVYTITLSDESKTLYVGDSYSLVALCSDNETTVTSPTIEYSSSNTSVATINSSGAVTTLSTGTTTLTATYNGVSDSVVLTVNAQPVVAYTSSWSNGSTGLKYMSSTTYTATKTIDSVSDPSLVISYEWDSVGANLVSSGKVTMTKKANNQWTIKNVNVQTITNSVLTWKDTATGEVILTAPFQFRYMS